MTIQRKAKNIPNITSIRFILAFFVVIFHISEFCKNRGFPYFNNMAIFHKGNEAVCMFFTLSGFLIIKNLYLEKKLTNTINLKTFYIKRALRIFPLYYIVLLFGFLYYRLILPFFGFEIENNYNLFSGFLLSISFFPNIFRLYSPGGILEILWSIGIEEQFYLFIAPTFLLLPIKKTVPFLIIFTIIYFKLYFSDNFIFLKKFSMLFFYFSFGGLFSILMDRSIINNLLKKTKYIILITFFIYFTSTFFKDNLSLNNYHLFSFVLFGLTLASLSLKPIKILENNTLRYLGKISFGIYMYHAIIIQFIAFIYLKIISTFNIPPFIDIVIINGLIITFTIILSHFSYQYYESYFLKLKKKLNPIK